jgi:uncharacterized membrane protein
MSASATLVGRARTRVPASTAEATRDQILVATGQVGAGVGNMAFALVMARLLSPGSFAELASFLALYTVLSLPGASISAAAALAPHRAHRMSRWLAGGGAVLGAALAASAPWSGPGLRLAPAMVVVLGMSGPVVGTLALERGRLYGLRAHGRLVGSLLMEPATRLTVGVVLALATGAVGGAVGITLAGYGALEIARVRRRRAVGASRAGAGALTAGGDPPAAAGTVAVTVAAFAVLVVIQNQDLLIANRMLSATGAGRFAVVSTLGGVAAFATLTTPLVLLPRSAADRSASLGPALGVTALLGATAVGLAAIAPTRLVVGLFGARYASVAPVVAPYVLAMALLGVARVLVAHRCGRAGRGRVAVLGAVTLAAVVQATLILTVGHDPRAVALSTLAATAGLTTSLGALELVRLPSVARWTSPLAAVLTRPATLAVTAAVVLAAGLRLLVPRGLWLDEATSVFQSRMGFHAMIVNLRTTDVHPPLYFSVLWATVRAFGSGELAVRMPSVVAGTLVIPMLYLLGKEAYDRRTGITAAFAGVVAPIMVWYSQEARMYALLMLFAVVALWAQVRLVKRGGTWLWALYALASAAMAWTQYFGLLQVGVQQMVFAGIAWGRYRRHEEVRPLLVGWLASAVVIGLALVPLVPFAHQQFVVNQTGGKGFGAPSQVGTAASLNDNHLGVYAAIANLVWAVWGYHSTAAMALLAALWPLGMLLALALLGRQRQPVTSLLVAAVVVPGAAMFVLGLMKRNLFDIRYLSTTVPVLFVLLARGVTAVARSRKVVLLGASILMATLVAGLVDQQFNGSNPRLYDFRGALGTVNAHARQGDHLEYVPDDLRQVISYYSPHLSLAPVGHGAPPAPDGHTVYVLASRPLMNGSSDNAALASTLDQLRAHDHLVARHDLSNVEVWVFR